MQFPWATLIWIVIVIFVYVFGLYEGRGQGYKKRKAEEEQEKKDKPAPAAERQVETRVETVTVDDPGLLRIKNENGTFALDLDGVRTNPLSFTSDQRKRLIEMLNMMRPWLEPRSASAPASKTTAAAPAAESLADRLDAFAGPSEPNPPAPLPPARPAPQPRPSSTAPRPSTIAKEDRPSVPANSIVGQIDSVLQARLEGTPLADRGIFLTQSAEGSVNVYVGLTRYNGIDDVPDPEIKAAIRAAISEWEDRYTPGLQR